MRAPDERLSLASGRAGRRLEPALPPLAGVARREGWSTLRVRDVLPCERQEMFGLLSEHYDFVTPEQFDADLDEKEWVILKTVGGRVVVFSTLMRIRMEVDGEPVLAFYSGDTIADGRHRGGRLAGGIVHFLQRLFAGTADPAPSRRYYLHVAGTCEGYLMMPALFRVSRPRHDQPLTPEASKVLVALARAKRLDYDPERSIVRLARPSVLRQNWAATLLEPDNPHIRFFTERNSGHVHGERLASLVELTLENLTPAARHLLGGGSSVCR